jgi:hypothetical protein
MTFALRFADRRSPWKNHFGHRKGAVRARAGETVLIPGSA